MKIQGIGNGMIAHTIQNPDMTIPLRNKNSVSPEQKADWKDKVLHPGRKSDPSEQMLREKKDWEELLKHQEKSFQMIKDLLFLITPGMEEWLEKKPAESAQKYSVDFLS